MAQETNSTIAAIQQLLSLNPISEPLMQDVIFVSIDLEAYEDDQGKITEIGVAVLDTRDLAGLSLDNVTSQEWMSKIKAAHYRPVEHSRKINRRYVKGCEQHFNFGSTTWIRLRDASDILNRIFRDPSLLDSAANFAVDIPDQKRNIIFVAHASKGDEKYLGELGFSLPSTIRKIDTGIAAGGNHKNTPGLARLACSLQLDPENLHNGGNDAVYTLQACVAMALKERANKGSVASDLALIRGKPPSKRVPKNANHVLGGTAHHFPSINREIRSRGTWKSKPRQKPTAEDPSSKNAGRRDKKEATRKEAQKVASNADNAKG